MLPDAPPYIKWEEEVARQLTDFNKRLQHLERLEDPAAAGYNICRVYHDVNQALPGGGNTTLNFNSETTDIPGWHNPAVNNSRITVDEDGLYFVQAIARVTINMTANTANFLAIYRNGALIGETTFFSDLQGNSISGFWSLVSGDFVEVVIRNQAAGGRTIQGGADVTHFTVVGSYT